MLATMLVFIPWDIIKTTMGVWGFNEKHLQGWYFFNLPVEEVFFFIAIPYACLFTYHSFEYLIRKDYLASSSKIITICLIVVLALVALINADRIYTFVTFIATALFLAIHLLFIKGDYYMGRFYFMYLVILLPFFLVNGALTGMFSPEAVVWYDNTQNLGIRIGTIPIEDSVYGLLLLLMNVTIYEALQSRSKRIQELKGIHAIAQFKSPS